MKKIFTIITCAFIAIIAMAQAPAFPGAEGHGRFVTGGRGGKIVHVTNLNDSGEGSLRQAVSGSAKKIVVFDVGGIIALKSDLAIGANTTIAGQTAPEPGITVRYYTIRPDADNIIVRFIRFRRGEEKNINDGADAIWTRNQEGMIFDHCSFSWSIDEVASFYDNRDFTMQWCSVAEALANPGHTKGEHSYGGIWGGKQASFHHNLIAHVQNRAPRLNGARYGWDGYDKTKYKNTIEAEIVDLRNCVFYNWGTGNGAYAGQGGYHNIVNNYYKAGPATKNKTRVFQCGHTTNDKDDNGKKIDPNNTHIYGHFYIKGNYVTAASTPANYDWDGVIVDDDNDNVTKDSIKLKNPVDAGTVTTHTAEKAFEKVLSYVGASLYRDAVDKRYAEEAKKGTTTYIGTAELTGDGKKVTHHPGIIDFVRDQGEYTLESTSHPEGFDTDGDGMSDEWETANGLNPNDASDAITYTIDSEKKWYTNIEVYINSIVEDIMKAGNSDSESSVDEYYPVCTRTNTGNNDNQQDNNLVWDYTENQIPTKGPDNGLYYAGYVNDAPSSNMKLNGVKLNSSGYAFFAKPAVAGKLTLTFGNRKASSAYTVNVYACTIAEGQATKGNLIGEIAIEESPGSGSLDIAADVTGIYIERKTSAEGVLQKIVFKENKARTFVDFEIPYEKLSSEYDPSELPAGVTFQGTKRGDSHGYGNVTITVPVDGTVKFTIGGCQNANPATCKVTNSAGELLAEPNLKTTNCYHQDKSSTTYIFTGAATTLTFSNIAYLPYFKAEATEVSEVTITYKDQNGNQLGTKKVFEGDEIGEIPYTEANLTIPEGYKFRGWVYTSGVKVKSTDVVTGNVSVNASVTAIETAPVVGSVQTYDLTQATFYPEDHELFSVTNGKYYNNHGFDFAAGGSFTVDVAGKAQVVLTLCQYGSGTTIEVKDAKSNVIQNDLAAKSTSDGGAAVLKYDGNATQLTFTFASQTYLHAVTVYNITDFMEKDAVSGYYIIPSGDAASLIMALNSASAEEGAKIFLPNGTYDLGEAVNTPISGNNVSIIGQSAENTIIVSAPPVALEGLGKADLLVNTGEGLYLQDLTLKNALDYYSAGSAGRAPTLHDKGTKTINKNVRHLSYQDTYYSHKTGGVYYFEGGEIHGTVDYMCGNGKVYFNEVNLVNEKHSNATMSANSELYVYNNCTVKQSEASQFNFGRAWSDNPVCIYLNTTLEEPEKLITTRWNLDGINCDYSKAGEYGTKNSAGENITPATNTVTFNKAKTELQTILDASALETYSIGNVLGDWAVTAQEQAKQIDAPSDAKYDNGTISWTSSNGATAYAIFKNDAFVGITTGTSYNVTVDAEKESLTIRAANARGGFGKAAAIAGTKTGIDQISNDNKPATFYNLQGMRVDKISKGIYITNGKKVVIN